MSDQSAGYPSDVASVDDEPPDLASSAHDVLETDDHAVHDDLGAVTVETRLDQAIYLAKPILLDDVVRLRADKLQPANGGVHP